MLNQARVRSKRKGIECSISLEDINIPTHCPVFGFELYRGGIKRTDQSPTLDRIDNAKGYIRGNIIVVSWLANRIKNDVTSAQLRIVADFYERITLESITTT